MWAKLIGLVGERRGPRIKHVCRRAAVVLGYPRAKFLMAPSLPKPDKISDQSKTSKSSKRKQNQGLFTFVVHFEKFLGNFITSLISPKIK